MILVNALFVVTLETEVWRMRSRILPAKAAAIVALGLGTMLLPPRQAAAAPLDPACFHACCFCVDTAGMSCQDAGINTVEYCADMGCGAPVGCTTQDWRCGVVDQNNTLIECLDS